MRPVIVMPLHDPDGRILSLLEGVTPQLKGLFGRAIVGVTSATSSHQRTRIGQLEGDNFFHTLITPPGISVGSQFRALYEAAIGRCLPSQTLHLCFPDRIAFALQNDFREAFTTDIQAVTEHDTPLLFHRSSTAWQTHPSNYRDIEQMATRVGELILKKSLDFAWCHLAIQAQQLAEAISQLHQQGIGILGEMVLLLERHLKTKEVDWLAWEDPYIAGCDAVRLREEREGSLVETRKRLSYVLPILQLLLEKENAPFT